MADPAERIVRLAKQLFEAKARKEKLEAQVTETNKEIQRLAVQELPQLMEDSELDQAHISGFGTVYLANEFYASVNKDDRPTLYGWLRENGYDDIIVDYVFPTTLTAFCKEQAEKNNPLPDCVKRTLIPTAKTRRT